MRDGLTTGIKYMSWSAMTTARGALDLAVATGSRCAVYEFTGLTAEGGVQIVTEKGILRHPCEVNNCEWNTSGSIIATAAADGVVRMWSANLKDGAWRENTMAA
jgi:WD40 repeat protein